MTVMAVSGESVIVVATLRSHDLVQTRVTSPNGALASGGSLRVIRGAKAP
jgi:hypothetical protein